MDKRQPIETALELLHSCKEALLLDHEVVGEIRRKAEKLAQLTQEGDRLPITRLHLAQDILCAALRLQGATDPEGQTGAILRSYERAI